MASILKVDKIVDSGSNVLATSSGSGHTIASGAIFPPGHVLNVVSVMKSDSFTQNPSSAWIDITGFSVTITPKNTSSKILVMTHIQGGGVTGVNSAHFRVLRGATAIGVGDQEGSNRERASSTGMHHDAWTIASSSFTFLDTPASVSLLTYKVQVFSNNTVWINRGQSHADDATTTTNTSTITLMEIAG